MDIRLHHPHQTWQLDDIGMHKQPPLVLPNIWSECSVAGQLYAPVAMVTMTNGT